MKKSFQDILEAKMHEKQANFPPESLNIAHDFYWPANINIRINRTKLQNPTYRFRKKAKPAPSLEDWMQKLTEEQRPIIEKLIRLKAEIDTRRKLNLKFVKSIYRNLAKKWHPDFAPESQKQTYQESFIQLRQLTDELLKSL